MLVAVLSIPLCGIFLQSMNPNTPTKYIPFYSLMWDSTPVEPKLKGVEFTIFLFPYVGLKEGLIDVSPTPLGGLSIPLCGIRRGDSLPALDVLKLSIPLCGILGEIMSQLALERIEKLSIPLCGIATHMTRSLSQLSNLSFYSLMWD